ncbi:MAG: alpha/beta hydrolase family protein [Paracoccaceae bacterium]
MAHRMAIGIGGATLAGWVAVATALLVATGPARGEAPDRCPPAPARHAPADERVVSLDTPDGRIAGTLAAPAGAAPEALALLLHGYTGSRDEIPVAGGEGMFARTARAFAERGIATLRIDLLGSGESDGAWADTRFSGQARDALRAAAALRAEHGGRDLPLGVLGYSQGGLVALGAAVADGSFDRVALWNPVMDPMATYGVIFGRETILDGARRHAEGMDAIVGETRLRPGFFAGIVEADPIADAARVEAPVLVVTGRRDPLVADGAALAGRMAAARAAKTLVLDLDAGHDLGATREPALLDEVIRCTAGFLLGESGR